jgi:hypothetical protein
VELAALAAGIDASGQVREELGIEGTASEGRAEVARVNAGEMRAEASGDHLASEFGGGDAERGAPDGEDGLESGAGEFVDAVGADIFEEEVSEGYAVEAFSDGSGADLSHARFVVSVRAGEREIYLPEGQSDGGGLLVKQLFAVAVDGDAAKFFVDGGEECDDLVLRLLAEKVKSPGAVLSTAPTEEDALWLAVCCGPLHGIPLPRTFFGKVLLRKVLGADQSCIWSDWWLTVELFLWLLF